MTETPKAITEYFRCVNAEDWEAFADLWTEDAELVAIGARTRRGRDAVLSYYAKVFDPWAEHHDEPTRILVADAAVTVEVSFRGTTLEGVDVAFDAIDLFDLVDGRIARLSNWYDILAARRAVGMT